MTDQTARLLAEIPALAAQLRPFLIPSNNPGSDGPRPAPTSRPPLNVDLLDLIAGREISMWVRIVYDTMNDMCQAGIFGSTWSERKAWLDAHPGPDNWDDLETCCDWLSTHAEWILEQFPEPEPIEREPHWVPLHCDEGHYLTQARVHRDGEIYTCRWCPQGFATAIRQLHAAYQRAAGNTPGPKISCPKCGNSAFIEGEWLICREVEEHARTVKDIEHDHRLAPPITTAEAVTRFAIGEDRIHQWKRRGKIRPARQEGRKLFWMPWDIFCLLNPTVAEAIEARDSVVA